MSAGLIDRRLNRFADVAERERFAQNLRAGLAFLDFVLHDFVRHCGEIGADQAAYFGAIRVGCAVADLALGVDERAYRHAGKQFVRRLFLQLADARRGFKRVVVTAFEIVEAQDHAELLAQHRLVRDVVLREHRFGVAANVVGKRLELGVVQDDLVQLAVDLVSEARHVGRFFDALLFLRMRARGDNQRDENRQAFRHHGPFPLQVA